MLRVLVVDDHRSARENLVEFLRLRGLVAEGAGSMAEALEAAARGAPDVVVSDVRMPGKDGLALLERLRADYPAVQVLLVTAYGTVPEAVQAVRRGAREYLTKPFDPEDLLAKLERIAEEMRLRTELTDLRRRVGEGAPDIVGESAPVQRLLAEVERAARADLTVLIEGPTGAGKELVARAIHRGSARSTRPLVAVSCAAIPRELAESFLFGHRRGAFTGATRDAHGRFVEADRGTLLLDDVGTLDLGIQAKLLRVVEGGELYAVGDERRRVVDVRLLCATNEDLHAAVARGAFREDLLFRLEVLRVRVPALEERRDDVPLLSRALLDRFSERYALGHFTLAEDALDVLLRAPWPGNVRQLDNVVCAAAAVAEGNVVRARDLPASVLAAAGWDPDVRRATFRQRVAAFERQLLSDGLRRAGGVLSRTAELLGIPERTLRRKLRAYRLRARDDKDAPRPAPRRGRGQNGRSGPG
ncbi:MAG TPA: sigma-54 dependent transcriptional regulator [Myxococcota bacterium]|nr:sigma-54 dependent transcriptional regulator [Myxococcota bacterium]